MTTYKDILILKDANWLNEIEEALQKQSHKLSYPSAELTFNQGKLFLIELLKSQLIPAKDVLEKVFDKGYSIGEYDGRNLVTDNYATYYKEKEQFLNTEL